VPSQRLVLRSINLFAVPSAITSKGTLDILLALNGRGFLLQDVARTAYADSWRNKSA